MLFAQQMNVMTFNIRMNTASDGVNAWPNRIEMVNGLLHFYDPDVFGLQEVLYNQLLDLEKGLPEYKWFGVGRDDGDKAGEFMPIFYNPKKLIWKKKAISGYLKIAMSRDWAGTPPATELLPGENLNRKLPGKNSSFLIRISTMWVWKPVKIRQN